jgi:hypothetical protein
MSAPTASEKLFAAAALLKDEMSPAAVKSLHSYLEGDLSKSMKTQAQRGQLALILGSLRADASPGAPTWAPNAEHVKERLLALARQVADGEPITMTRAELNAKLEAARQFGLSEAAQGRDDNVKPRRASNGAHSRSES